jgi:hypothetical protein
MTGRCGNCGRSRPKDETVQVFGNAGGNYRRGNRSIRRRLCRDCVERHVAYVREQQAKGAHTPLTSSHFDYQSAAAQFGIEVGDLWTSQWMTNDRNIITVETRYADGRKAITTTIRN